MMENWVTIKDYANHLHVSYYIVRSMIETGRIPAVKLGKEWRIDKSVADEQLKNEMQSSVGRQRKKPLAFNAILKGLKQQVAH